MRDICVIHWFEDFLQITVIKKCSVGPIVWDPDLHRKYVELISQEKSAWCEIFVLFPATNSICGLSKYQICIRGKISQYQRKQLVISVQIYPMCLSYCNILYCWHNSIICLAWNSGSIIPLALDKLTRVHTSIVVLSDIRCASWTNVNMLGM